MKKIFPLVAILLGVSISTLMGAEQSMAQGSDATPKEPKADSFLATNPNLVRTLAFINDSLVAKLRFIGQHNPAGQVLMGKSLLHLSEDRNGRHRRLVRFETHVLEDMSNRSDSPRSHLSVATALQDDLNVGAASSSGDYVLVPCKTGKKCVENKLILSDSYDHAPSSLPGLGTLMTDVWAPPSVLLIGPFPEGQASSMVPVVQYLLSR
jgi:hypothetical protein